MAMIRRWSFAPAQPLLAEELASSLRLPPLLVQCLINRGISDSESMSNYLDPRLKALSDPFDMPNMEKAVRRLFLARERGERLVVFGDYDVDGVTSTALLIETLGRLGWNVAYYLPHRLEEGYGLSQDGVENCLKKFQVSLLVAVDCGSTAVSTIAWLRTQGIETIVLDHHQVCSPEPEVAALVSPQLNRSSSSPTRDLCSVGVAFKLAHALVKWGRKNALPGALEFDVRTLLDLAALGTIADLVPLSGENRILVSAGLARLNATTRPGLIALKKVARTDGVVGVQEVGFQLAPRLNAAGRLENALHSLELLLAKDANEAERLALTLDTHNRERQQIERKMADQIIAVVRSRFNPETDFVIVEGELLWHLGVVGIVASRVLREFYRPAIVLGGEGEDWRGSGRSIEGFDLAAALRSCSDLLTRHGGHAMAAGLSLPAQNVALLRQRLNELARQALTPELLRPVLKIDAEVALRDLSHPTVKALARMEPLGQGNPAVQLAARNLVHSRPCQRMGKDQQHFKFWVSDGSGTREAVWWNGDEKRLPEGRFDLAFSPQINVYNQQESVQLKILDWRPSV